MNKSEQINELLTALSIAQGQLKPAIKDTQGYGYKYSDLASVWDVIREPFSKNSLSIIQLNIPRDDNKIQINTILGHSSGQWIESSLVLTSVKQDPQATGSAITYARRYSLMAIAGIAPEDDDGAEASKEKNPEREIKKSTIKTEGNKTKEEQILAITKMIMEMAGNNEIIAKEFLQQFSKFKGKEGEAIPGYDSFRVLSTQASEERIRTIYGKTKEQYKNYKEGVLPPEDENGY